MVKSIVDIEREKTEKMIDPTLANNDIHDLIYRLRKRSNIRRNIQTRKSVQEGKPDRISDLLDEAATELGHLLYENEELRRNQNYFSKIKKYFSFWRK